MIHSIICNLFHVGCWKVVQAYSNRTHRWHCRKCHREWDGH